MTKDEKIQALVDCVYDLMQLAYKTGTWGTAGLPKGEIITAQELLIAVGVAPTQGKARDL